MRRCVDCGLDISDRPARSYLCLRCKRARRRARQHEWFRRMMADPDRHAHHTSVRRGQWKPRPLKGEVIPCVTPGCAGTFVRRWPRNNQKFCAKCSAFYAREGDLESSRRYYRRHREAWAARHRAKTLRRAA